MRWMVQSPGAGQVINMKTIQYPYQLTGHSEFDEAEVAFRKVFKASDNKAVPLLLNMEHRTLLLPTAGSILHEPHSRIVCNAASAIGDHLVYYSELDGLDFNNFASSSHWKYRCDTQKNYYSAMDIICPVGVENLNYSIKGTWGVIVSDFDFVLVGGSTAFNEKVIEQYPDYESVVKDYIAYWLEEERQNGIDMSWLPLLLTHVFGRTKAIDLLNE